MIAFACSCGRQFSVKPEFAGRSTRCPTCQQALVVPTPVTATVGYEMSAASGPAASPTVELEDALARFEADWDPKSPPRIEKYLPAAGPLRGRLICELALIDLEFHLKARLPARVESYLTRYPELAGDDTAILALIAAEFRFRRRIEPALQADEYYARFPHYREQLASHLGVLPTCVNGAAPAAMPGPTAAPAGLERYVMGAEIARGGMGAVVQATDRQIRREVAVKFLLDQSNQEKKIRFIEEAQITGQLEHPNVVPVHELGLDARQRLFFSMKMVKGRSLAQVLAGQQTVGGKQTREFSLSRLLNVFVGVCHALAYAHARGVIHRDLKPANIMLGDFGEVYVMDWGLAKVLGPAGAALRLEAGAAVGPPAPAATMTITSPGGISDTQAFRLPDNGTLVAAPEKVVTGREAATDLTQEGAILGTPVYMPPEQALGKIQAIDERSDIYSLGAILYEILTLQPPIRRDGTYLQVLGRVAQGEIVPPAQRAPQRARAGQVPAELAAIAMKALALAQDQRYQTVEFLRRDVELYLDGRSVSAKEDSRAEVLLKFVRRNKAFSAVTAAAVCVVTLVVAWSLIVNLQARRDIEKAYAAYEQEQKEKEARTRLAVPALVKVAQLEVDQQGLDKALGQINLALEYDPDNLEGRLLRARLLIAKQDFAGARTDLDSYLASRPKDAHVRELRQLCGRVHAEDEDKSTIILLAQALAAQNYPLLAEYLLKQHGDSGDDVRQELLSRYRARLAATWPRQANNLTLDPLGFHLKLKGDEVRDLAPLKGMILHSLDLDCEKLTSLVGLEGLPLKELAMQKTRVASLAPLLDLPLTALVFQDCYEITDLTPLAGAALTTLTLQRCNGIHDLTPLRNMPLATATLSACGISDLSPVKGLPLTALDLSYCPGIRNLGPLEGMPLKALSLAGCTVGQDLRPLTRMPLTRLDLSGCMDLRGLAALQGLPLTKLELRSCQFLSDLSGLGGMKLTSLDLFGCAQVVDLSPLKGVPIKFLDLSHTGIKDIGPVRGMPLVSLALAGCTHLADLTALKGLQFTRLDLSGCTALTDLAPLQGMPLHTLLLSNCTNLENLTPLQGIPLNTLLLDGCTKLTHLAPLKDAFLTRLTVYGCASLGSLAGLEGMRMSELDLSGCVKLTDLHGLRGGSLNKLRMSDCRALVDLSGLQGLPLGELDIQNAPTLENLAGLAKLSLKQLVLGDCPRLADITALRGMPLTKLVIARCEKLSDLGVLATLPLTELALVDCRAFSDLSLLRGRRIVNLQLPGCAQLADLGPLRDMPLEQLNIASSRVTDLTPLAGLPLKALHLEKCLDLHDLRPLKGLKLVEIQLPPQVTSGLEMLQNMTTLEKIDGKPAATFWRAWKK